MKHWINLDDELPKEMQKIWLYDKMFDRVEGVVIVYIKEIDGDYTHWMPRKYFESKPNKPILD